MSEPRVLPAFAEASLGEPLQRLSDAGWGRIEAAQEHSLRQIYALQAQQETALTNDTLAEMGAILRKWQAPQTHLRPNWADNRQPAGGCWIRRCATSRRAIGRRSAGWSAPSSGRCTRSWRRKG